ncbi:sulfatase [Prosthecobacter sp.]|uniref:sulfatase n=1 Tax=Prosthecobacter sp. TaxID=1965333 RepID=UPI0037844F55
MRLLLALACTLASAFATPPNVLFIASDDMRPQLGCYGDTTVKSPNIDALAKRGMVFQRSYVQQALCSPSRISMLSGRYPATTGIFEIGRTLRTTLPDITTLPQHFKNNGYHTRSLGKIYHEGIDDEASWTVRAWRSKKPRTSAATQEGVKKYIQDAKARGVVIPDKGKGSRMSAVPAFEAVECADDDLLDGDCASNAIAQLREHAKTPAQPFFLAVGFSNPHVPWISPKRYWDLYDRSKLPLATNTFLPKGAPQFAATSGNDFRWYAGVPEGELPEPYARECLHGYLAAISYVDAQVGRLMAALDETGLAKNTIIVFWSDHGYYMGEHTWWGSKHNNYEGATRNCLVISTPDMKHAGEKTEALVQSVDLAPTLTELCGLPASTGFQGRSLKPVLDDPAAAVNDAAYSWYPKAGYLGLTMRTDKWRYVEWTKPGAKTEYELYNMVHDPQNNVNVADKPEHTKIIEALGKRLREKFPVQEFKNPQPK